MDSSSLSAHERRIWQRTACALQQDERLLRRLRTIEGRRPLSGRLHSPGRSLALLCILSVTSSIVAVACSFTPLIVAFGALSVVTVTVALIRLCVSR